jgi:DNA-binding SARP family transcriptional activator
MEAGLLTAGVLSIIEALRRRQRQHRREGRRIGLPAGALAITEQTMRLDRRPDRVDEVAAALHALARCPPGAVAAEVLGVVAGDRGVDLLLADPVPAPEPWISAAEPLRWRLANGHARSTVRASSECLPALAPVGRATGGDDDVLLNLEAIGLIGVTGGVARASGLTRGMAIGLATLPWAEAVDVVLVGFGHELSESPRVRNVATLGEVLGELRSRAAVMEELQQAHGCSSVVEARLRGVAGDGWPPTVVLCAAPLPDEDLVALAALAVPGGGVAAVVPQAIGTAPGWALDVERDVMPVGPLRLAVDPTLVSADELAAVGLLMEVAAQDVGVTVDEPPYDRLSLSVDREPRGPIAGTDALAGPRRSTSAAEQSLAADPGLEPAGEDDPEPVSATDGAPEAGRLPLSAGAGAGVWTDDDVPSPVLPPVFVRVLGTVEIDGAGAWKRAKSRELAVYLALHPNGVGEAELDEALWPSDRGRLVAPSTRDSTVSVARTALGGPSRLLPAQGQGREKRYQVGPDVGSDFAVFCALHREGRRTEALEPLTAAVRLVRGRPFEGVVSGRTYTWVHTEGHAHHIEAEVGDAADLAASILLGRARPLEARWAARRGLAADPWCERLWIRLMQAADDLGESQEVERVMDELDAVLELGGDFSSLHPTTLAAYERHRRRPRRGGQPA